MATKFQALKEKVIGGDYDTYIRGVLGYELLGYHRRMFQHQLDHRRSLIIGPRGFGKSVICNTAYSTNAINKDKNLRVAIGSKTLPKAQKLLRLARGHYTDNEALRAVSGITEFQEKDDGTWSASELTIQGRTEYYPEATFSAIGMQGTLVSNHYDMIIGDDFVDDKNCEGKKAEDLQTSFTKELMPMMNPYSAKLGRGGENHMIGTRYSDIDLYQFIIETGKFELLVIPCYYNKRTNKYIYTLDHLLEAKKDGDLASIWPERFSLEHLEDTRQIIGDGDFFSQYMGNTAYYSKKQDEAFFMENIREYQSMEEMPAWLQSKKLIGAIDPSTGKEHGDYFVCGVASAGEEGPIWARDVVMDKLKREDQARVIAEMDDAWKGKIAFWVLEANGFQYALYDDMLALGIPESRIVLHYAKESKKLKFRKLRGVLDYRGLRVRTNMKQCVRQIKMYPDANVHDDFLDWVYMINQYSEFDADYPGQYDSIEMAVKR